MGDTRDSGRKYWSTADERRSADDHETTISTSKIAWVAVLAVAVRIAFIAVFADLHTNYYWEYGDPAKNPIDGRGYS